MIVRRPSAADLKHNLQAAHDEFKLLQYLHSLGLAAPQPYHLDHTGQIFPTPALVTEYIEGALQFAPADSDDFILQFSTHLAEIHRIAGTHPDLAFLPRQANPCLEISKQQPLKAEPSFEEARIRAALKSVGPLSGLQRPGSAACQLLARQCAVASRPPGGRD